MYYLRLLVCVGLTAASGFCLAEANHQFDFSNRTRYADVSEDTQGKDFSTLLRFDLRSHWSDMVSSTLELDYVKSFLPDDHSDGVHINHHAMIVDAPGADLNQAFVRLNFEDARVDLGRQRLAYDSQRFIGGNGFWQNEQTFDAASTRIPLQSNSAIDYAYVFNVNRIFGDKADKDFYDSAYNKSTEKQERPAYLLGDHEHKTHLARIEWNEWDYSQLVAYSYLIRNQDLTSDSSNTFGASYSFNYKGDQLKYRAQIEAATQKRTEIADAPRVPYYLIDAGIGINTVEFSGRYEVMGADRSVPFITPLGSPYDFMGWANRFGTTPATGVEDSSLRLLWRAAPFRIDARYHIFYEYDGDKKLGTESDFDIVYKPVKKHALSLRFAYFEPDSSSEHHIRKLYLDYTYNL